jgi:hypothetical protein
MYALSSEHVDDIGSGLETFPRTSLTMLAWQTGMPASSAQDAMKLLRLCPYNATVVHKLYSTT